MQKRGEKRDPPIRRTDGEGQFRPDRTNHYIGVQIRTGRRLLGISRAEMAEQLGAEVAVVSAYEHGSREVPPMVMAQIADMVNKPLPWFYHWPTTTGREVDTPLSAPSQADQGAGEPAASAEPATVAHVTAPDVRPTILLVDDAADVLVTLGAFLEGVGFRVIKAASGDEALRVVAGDEVLHAIVTDNFMPGMSGCDLLVQSAQLRPSLPALIVTGFADASTLRDLPATVEVLCKPFRRSDLVLRVCALTNARALPAAAPRRRVAASVASGPGKSER